jgi:hypothetical protein
MVNWNMQESNEISMNLDLPDVHIYLYVNVDLAINNNNWNFNYMCNILLERNCLYDHQSILIIVDKY